MALTPTPPLVDHPISQAWARYVKELQDSHADLLAALKALVNETELRDNPSDEGVSSDDDTMVNARAAIQKAEGR